MAALQFRHGGYRVLFRYHGKQHTFLLGQVSKEEAESKADQVEYLLMRLKQRLATVPPGVGIVEYVQFDGQARPAEGPPPPAEGPQPPADVPPPPAAQLSLAQLRDRYLATYEASLEANTLATIRMHFRHLAGQLGERFPIAELSLAELQQYVEHRAKAQGRLAIEELGRILDHQPGLVAQVADLSAHIRQDLIDRLAKGDQLLKQSIEKMVAARRNELMVDPECPIQTLTADRVMIHQLEVWLLASKFPDITKVPIGLVRRVQLAKDRAECRARSALKAMQMLRRIAPKAAQVRPPSEKPIVFKLKKRKRRKVSSGG